MIRISIVLVALVTTFVTAQRTIPDDMKAMADTEREFARTATVKGVRDAFLDFFSDDAIALTPTPAPAKDGIRKWPSRPFSESGIVWEPRTGDVAASGEVGWLTGPATYLSAAGAAKPVRYGCYLSVWRKQPDGRWRVYIDVGINAPAEVPFAPGLTRTTVADPFRGKESKETASTTLIEADRALNARAASAGSGHAYRDVLTSESRLHRNDTIPILGPDAISAWLDRHAASMTAQTGTAETSNSGDLGYSYGTYKTTGDKPEAGPYVRIWSRDAAGRWWLMADVAHPAR